MKPKRGGVLLINTIHHFKSDSNYCCKWDHLRFERLDNAVVIGTETDSPLISEPLTRHCVQHNEQLFLEAH